jgi:hypothetical protein
VELARAVRLAGASRSAHAGGNNKNSLDYGTNAGKWLEMTYGFEVRWS